MIGSKDKNIVSISHLREIFEEMKKYDITRLVVNRGDETYEIWRGKTFEKSMVNVPPKQSIETVSETKEPAKEDVVKEEVREPVQEKKEDKNLAEIKTPIVGTFYRASSPDSDPYVDIGSKVKKGDTLCIVEAMKSMNEIESEISGTVEEILTEDGKMVEYDQVLFKIKIG